MNFYTRPSKTFLFDILEKKLKNCTGEIGIDAACETMKNQKMFKTKKYYGIDIVLELLKKGIAKHNFEDVYGILGDLSKLDKMPDGSADVVVSTNTLYILPANKRLVAIKHLSRITSPHGYFLCELNKDTNYQNELNTLKHYFSKMEIVYFGNSLSRAYEKIFEKKGWLGYHPIASQKPFLLLSWIISRLEYLTCQFSGPNSNSLIVCSGKESKTTNEFNIKTLPLIEEKIYNIL